MQETSTEKPRKVKSILVTLPKPDSEKSPYFDLAKTYGYQVFSLIVENRHGGLNQHGVPEDKVQIMKDRFEIKL